MVILDFLPPGPMSLCSFSHLLPVMLVFLWLSGAGSPAVGWIDESSRPEPSLGEGTEVTQGNLGGPGQALDPPISSNSNAQGGSGAWPEGDMPKVAAFCSSPFLVGLGGLGGRGGHGGLGGGQASFPCAHAVVFTSVYGLTVLPCLLVLRFFSGCR